MLTAGRDSAIKIATGRHGIEPFDRYRGSDKSAMETKIDESHSLHDMEFRSQVTRIH